MSPRGASDRAGEPITVGSLAGTTDGGERLVEVLGGCRVMAVLRRPDIATAVDGLADGLRQRGVRAIECTLDQPGALGAVERLVAGRQSGEVVGAGTVTTTAQVDALVAIGADFAVSPHLDEALLAHAVDVRLPFLPGVTTPSELARAVAIGAPAVKLFPAGPLGVPYLSALRGPFPDVAVVPTGGIAVEDVADWLAAGALCVGLGSALTRGGDLPAGLADVLAGAGSSQADGSRTQAQAADRAVDASGEGT